MRSVGQMRNIRQFHPFTLENKIRLKPNKDLSDDDIASLSLFLRSMLQYWPNQRKEGGAAAREKWLSSVD